MCSKQFTHETISPDLFYFVFGPVGVCKWRPEVDIGCLPVLLSAIIYFYYIFVDNFLHEYNIFRSYPSPIAPPTPEHTHVCMYVCTYTHTHTRMSMHMHMCAQKPPLNFWSSFLQPTESSWCCPSARA